MEQPRASTSPGDGTAPATPDWPSRATAAVESFVELIRDKSLRPALLALKLVLIGLVVAALGTAVLVLGLVGVVRLLTHDAFGGRVWGADLLVGTLLVAAGGILFRLSRRTMKADNHV